MKRFVALFLAVIMTLGCFAFAEETQVEGAVHQEMLYDYVYEFDDEFDETYLTTNTMSYLASFITGILTMYDYMTEEQIDEILTANTNIYAEIVNMGEGDAEKVAELISTNIDAMQTVGVVAKANLKSSIMENLMDVYAMNDDERTMVYVVSTLFMEALEDTTPEEREELAIAVFDSFGAIPYGPHDVRDDLITLYNQVSVLSNKANVLATEYNYDGRLLANAFVYIHSSINNPLTDDELAMVEEVLDNMSAEITALGLTDAELTEEQEAAVMAIANEAISNFSSLTDTQRTVFEYFIRDIVVDSRGIEPVHAAVIGVIANSFRYMIECADVENLAVVDQHVANIINAFINNDSATITAEVQAVCALTAEHRREHLIECLATLEDDQAIIAGIKLVFQAWRWNTQPEALNTSLVDILMAEEIDPNAMSEEDTQVLVDSVKDILGDAADDPAYASVATEDVVAAIQLYNNLTDDQKNNIDHLINSTVIALEATPVAQRVAIDTTIEKIASEINMSEERHNPDIESLFAINFSDAIDERFDEVTSISEGAMAYLISFMTYEYQIFKRLPEEHRGLFAEVNLKISEIAMGLEIKGLETDPAVVAQFEAAVNEMLTAYPNLPPFMKAVFAAKAVANMLNFTCLDAADQEILSTTIYNLDQFFINATDEELETFDAVIHSLKHDVYGLDEAE